MNFQALLKKERVHPFVLEARFGLEKESQRATMDGYLATTPHPASLGNRSYHPYIQTDFSESQMELITPVANSINELLRYLAAIQDVALRSIHSDEVLWPLSMPPILPKDNREIKIAELDNLEDVLYRRYLAKEYGKRKQMVSGIHFNFEFSMKLVSRLFEEQSECATLEDFKNIVYMKVARNYLRYRWLITYLFGASPISEADFFRSSDTQPQFPVRSIRNSSFGYKNKEDVQVSYISLERYVSDIKQLVDAGTLLEEKEFYSAVRLRGGKEMADLAQSGIRYIEIRNLDLNPFSPLGLEEESLEFIHLFMLYLLWTEEKENADDWVATGDFFNEQIALGHPFVQIKLIAEGDRIFNEMEEMIEVLGLFQFSKMIRVFREQLRTPDLTIAGKMWTIIEQNSNHDLGIVFGKEYQALAYEQPYQLAGFRSMELSTQLFLFDCIQKGIAFEILDEKEHFLKLTHKNHIEYVKNANMTSHDRYIVPLMMENKTVTKKVLAATGFNVPAGEEYDTMEQAEQAYLKYAEQAFVVKPKSTNYGLGITVFKEGASLKDYIQAITIAFKEDSAILIEAFLPGTEYRFFVLDYQVKAIMLRVPANVVGDGVRSVEALVAEKNLDPLRGTNHRAPLEMIQLGELERLMLKEQQLMMTSIPQKGQVVYLRENSNISTGGDSIDVTDEIDESYKQIAIEAVKTLGATICGIDLIIPNKQVRGHRNNHLSYGIIEANFNPAMHMHMYPHAGKRRHLTMDVLKLLYPELFCCN